MVDSPVLLKAQSIISFYNRGGLEFSHHAGTTGDSEVQWMKTHLASHKASRKQQLSQREANYSLARTDEDPVS